MGRMSAYTGKVVTWDQALNSKEELMPANLTLGPLPTPPVAVPGQTPLIYRGSGIGERGSGNGERGTGTGDRHCALLSLFSC
jgi:hypothetical protein